ncbi:CorA family divalent cation transporter [Microbacterium gorillae]|uniref:CorA family divalent cation transporter n=1 Tax=Microbacterium gorillae TaxID=1231063 RepID=UPI000693CC0E|nr:CorA family divalent cation transporter [Microbacterium gorillae]
MTEIRVLADGRFEQADDYAVALSAAASGNGVAWFDALLDDDRSISEIGQALGWRTALGDILRHTRKRARMERTGGQTVVVMLPARYRDDQQSVELSSLGVVVSADAIVTLRGDAWVDLSRTTEVLQLHPSAQGSSIGVLWAICSSVLDAYAPVITGVEENVDQIVEQLFEQDDVTDVSRRIFTLQRELIRLQHATEPVAQMLDQLADDVAPDVGEALVARFRASADAAEHVQRRVQGLRDALDNALTVHSTLVGERSNLEVQRMTEISIKQNDQVKKISSWAAIGFAPSLIAGIYGMNFHLMPELSWQWGYPYAIALMVAVSGGLYWVFRRHDWL